MLIRSPFKTVNYVEDIIDAIFDKNDKYNIIKNEDDSVEIQIQVAGFKKEDIKVKYTDGYLNISSENEIDDGNKNKKYMYKQLYKEKVNYSFYIGNDLTEDNINARIENGYLYIKISFPKSISKDIIIA